jgi:hypothetical protein
MRKKEWSALAVVVALLAAAALLLSRVAAQHRLGPPGLKLVNEPTLIAEGGVAQTNSVYLPAAVLDFTSQAMPVSSIEVNWLPKDTLFGRRYYRGQDGFSALLSVVLMGTDRTSIHKPQYCLESQGWHIDKTETAVVPVQKPYPYELRVMKLTTSKKVVENGQARVARGLYVYWFVADQMLTPYHGERMWWMARNLLRTGVLQRWAYVTYLTGCWPGQEEAAFNRLKDFIAASVPEFQLATGSRSATVATAAVAQSPPP